MRRPVRPNANWRKPEQSPPIKPTINSWKNDSVQRVCPDQINVLGLNLKFSDRDTFIITYYKDVVYVADSVTHPQIYTRLGGGRSGIDVRLWRNKKILTVWIRRPLEEIIQSLFQIKDKLLNGECIYIKDVHRRNGWIEDGASIDISDYKFIFESNNNIYCYTFDELEEKYHEILELTKDENLLQVPIFHILSPIDKIRYQTEEQLEEKHLYYLEDKRYW
jgi:hypothetical protein